ncbi:hypothetical protein CAUPRSCDRAFT_12605 [Caulochytrium protostelioides]|uniref:Uncharacterized protein n=1 Tax=Caulochytrium protostelioides TaxID=1555241 RepID=A0A4V1IT37_9FUNG|nr:hypothetical protein CAUPRSCDRAFT_12605 [Caulochytrium protostelioides]
MEARRGLVPEEQRVAGREGGGCVDGHGGRRGADGGVRRPARREVLGLDPRRDGALEPDPAEGPRHQQAVGADAPVEVQRGDGQEEREHSFGGRRRDGEQRDAGARADEARDGALRKGLGRHVAHVVGQREPPIDAGAGSTGHDPPNGLDDGRGRRDGEHHGRRRRQAHGGGGGGRRAGDGGGDGGRQRRRGGGRRMREPGTEDFEQHGGLHDQGRAEAPPLGVGIDAAADPRGEHAAAHQAERVLHGPLGRGGGGDDGLAGGAVQQRMGAQGRREHARDAEQELPAHSGVTLCG